MVSSSRIILIWLQFTLVFAIVAEAGTFPSKNAFEPMDELLSEFESSSDGSEDEQAIVSPMKPVVVQSTGQRTQKAGHSVQIVESATIEANEAVIDELMDHLLWIERGADKIDYSHYGLWLDAIERLFREMNDRKVSGSFEHKVLNFVYSDTKRFNAYANFCQNKNKVEQELIESMTFCKQYEATPEHQKYLATLDKINAATVSQLSPLIKTREDFLSNRISRGNKEQINGGAGANREIGSRRSLITSYSSALSFNLMGKDSTSQKQARPRSPDSDSNQRSCSKPRM